MTARRLLVLCYFYPPLAGGGVHRILGFTCHLPLHGWRTTVICAGERDFWVRDESLVGRIPPETEVLRVPGGSALATLLRFGGAPRHGRRSGQGFAVLRRLSDWWLLPDSYAGWSRRAARVAVERVAEAARGEEPGFDAVLSSSPPDSVHLAGLAVKRRFGLPWVADFRDPWMSLVFRTPPTRWHRTRQEGLESSVLEGADLVLAASRTHADRLAARPGLASRVVHLPNGYETDETESGSEAVSPANGADGGARFRMVYSGLMSLMPDVPVFLEALHDFLAPRPEARRRVRVSLVGPYDTGYADRAIALGLTPGIVEFLGPRSHAGTRALQRAADVLLLWKPRAMPTMVPGKTYEYLDAARPVLAVLEPSDEAALLVQKAGGTIVPPNDRRRLAAEIERHYDAWRAGTPLAAARPEWLEEHTRARLAGRLAGRLDALVEARR